MLRSDALRNKIYLMSFNLTVVLSQLLNRGRQLYSCVCAQCMWMCAVNADVFINHAIYAGIQL